MESHLETAMKIHLDLACVKLHDTEAKLNDLSDKLHDTKVKLNNTELKLKVKLSKNDRKLNETKDELHTRRFIWKIDGFSEVLRQAMTGGRSFIHSDPFYTATGTESYGYKLKVKISPNGQVSGKNTHLSVYIIVMKGEYDAILSWPFKKRVKFTVIDQQEDADKQENVTFELPIENTPAFARPVTEENAGRGFGDFISHKKLNSRRYIVDDTLFLQVEISSPSS